MNWELPSLHGGSLEITLTVPLRLKSKIILTFLEHSVSLYTILKSVYISIIFHHECSLCLLSYFYPKLTLNMSKVLNYDINIKQKKTRKTVSVKNKIPFTVFNLKGIVGVISSEPLNFKNTWPILRRYYIAGGGDRVSVHFNVKFLDCWRTSFS